MNIDRHASLLRPRLNYTRERLYALRRNLSQYDTDSDRAYLLSRLSAEGILHYRGCRGGQRKQRTIPVLVTNRLRDQVNGTQPHIRRSFQTNSNNYNNHSRQLVTITTANQLDHSNTLASIHNTQSQREIPRIYLLNAASLAKPHAIEQLTTELIAYSIDICVITETHFKKHHTEGVFNIRGYQLFHRDRLCRRGGGVAIFLREGMDATVIKPDNDHQDYETLWINLLMGNNHLICAAIYHPPKPIYNVSLFKQFLADAVDELGNSFPTATIVLAGDFNQLSDDEVCATTALNSIVKDSTRGSSKLDRVYTSSCKQFDIKIVKSSVKSDHLAVILTDNDCVINTLKKKETVNYRSKSPTHNANFLAHSCNISFDDVLNCNSVQLCADTFYSISNALLDRFYPLKSITITNCDPPFITPEVKCLLRMKNSLMHSGQTEKAGAVALKVGKIIARYNSTRLSHLNTSSGTKELWEEVRRLTSPSKQYQLPCNINAQTLNDHYASISNDPAYSPPIMKDFVQPSTTLVTEQQVFFLLDKLVHTSSGPDNIPSWFLRLAAPIFASPLAHLINISFATAIVPLQWKSATIHPAPKVPNPTLLSDFRPISVVPILSRLAERLLVREYLTPSLYNLPQHLVISNQFAYRPTTSTTAALIAILSHITELLRTNTHVFLIAFDYSKAFDTLSHSSLATKLANLEIPDCIFNWILDYLSDRSHATYIDGSLSSTGAINASIVQGSVLGPTLFNINSSELKSLSSNNSYFKYADDSYLIVPGSNAETILPEIQHHASWAAGCNLKFNISKTAEIVFCNKKTLPPPPNPGIVRCDVIKILGVHLDNKLRFSTHLDEIITSCNRSLFALRTMRQHGMTAQALQSIFKATVIPKLLYASAAWWGYTTEGDKNRLASFLRRAVKFDYYKSTDPDILSLQDAIENKLFNCIKSNKLHCLYPMLPPPRQTNYGLRQRGHIYKLPLKDDRNFINRMLFKTM